MSSSIVSNVDVISAVLRYGFISRRGLENVHLLLRGPTFCSSVESFFEGKYNEMKQHLNTGLFNNGECDN